MSRKAKVFWTSEEKKLVIEKAVEISWTREGYIWEFVNLAQKLVLPENRRRWVVSKANVKPDLVEMFFEIRQEVLQTGVPFEVPVEVQIPKEVLVERPRGEILNGITNKELFELLAERIASIADALSALAKKEGLMTSVMAPTETRARF